MNGYASVNQYIFTSAAQWLRRWPVMREVVGLSPVLSKDFPHFLYSVFFNVLTNMCKLKFTGLLKTNCLIQNITAKQIVASVLFHAVYYNAYKNHFGNAMPKQTQTYENYN